MDGIVRVVSISVLITPLKGKVMLYKNTGKQVLRGEDHVCDAADVTYAQIIADALNDRHKLKRDVQEMAHRVEVQNDEYACACGMRWDRADGSDHP